MKRSIIIIIHHPRGPGDDGEHGTERQPALPALTGGTDTRSVSLQYLRSLCPCRSLTPSRRSSEHASRRAGSDELSILMIVCKAQHQYRRRPISQIRSYCSASPIGREELQQHICKRAYELRMQRGRAEVGRKPLQGANPPLEAEMG